MLVVPGNSAFLFFFRSRPLCSGEWKGAQQSFQLSCKETVLLLRGERHQYGVVLICICYSLPGEAVTPSVLLPYGCKSF